LFLIRQGLAECQRTLHRYNLLINTVDWSRIHASAREQEEQATSAQLGHQLQSQLNTDQASCFNAITAAITDDPQTAQFYLQGPGGTGKTFLYKALCHHYRGLGRKVLCVASTGIAALLLPNGRTAHSCFKIPIQIHESATCTISMSSSTASLLRAVDLIIWDEVPMQHRYCFEVVHRLFCDLRSVPNNSPDTPLFGGTPAVLGGDFAQILPVVPGGSRADTVTACLQRSFIWPRDLIVRSPCC
jgi:ATP-dependent DNA helicase PIF1